MKVYVDELPKCCDDCKFQVFIAHHQNGWKHKERYCSIMTDNYDCKCSKENCPLQSLADYTKQVRKEVCEEIREKLNWKDGDFTNNQYLYIMRILNQIQGETKCEVENFLRKV